LLAKKADNNSAFRRLLPHGLSDEREKAGFDAGFLKQLDQLIAQTDFSSIQHANFTKEQRPDVRGLFSDVLKTRLLTADSLVCRRPFLNYSIERDDEWIILRFEGEEIVLPLFLESSMVKMLGTTPFKVREIEGVTTEAGKLAIVKRFVALGFLTIISP
jgi:hypothetical protein